MFRDKMHKLFDGGWITHSVGMLTSYFKKHQQTPGVLVLPQVRHATAQPSACVRG
jgi:hypothetical protein